ncbi:hypothetical protein C7999DRAFT_40904 [Corynascus novoguineensis]|uniref:Uncharacterized protein n=1 Tax=Corynascus novoguineensis TaxID=1126955 RepID=A0AAN7HFJ4_9PEZI|nr:hypothetical protein C7999DRAFT_40904 [Corynascus novoguineensis]
MSTFGCPSTAATLSTREHAGEFDVTVEFLLQMASYLTERHTSQLRAHMLRAAAARGSNAPSPVPGAEHPGNSQFAMDPMRRASLGTGRAPSALSIRKDAATPVAKNGDEVGTAGPVLAVNNAISVRPGSSRNPSTNPAVPYQTQQDQPGIRPGTATRLGDPARRRFSRLPTPSSNQPQPLQRHLQQDAPEIPPSSPAASTTSSSSSSSSDSYVESRIIRRPPRFQKPPKDPRTGGNGPFDDDDDDDDEPAFLPFMQQGATSGSGQDLGATLRGNNNRNPNNSNVSMRELAGRGRPVSALAGAGTVTMRATAGGSGDDAVGIASQSHSQTSDSSVGSAAVVPRRPATAGPYTGDHQGRRAPAVAIAGGAGQQQGPLSPRRTAELAAARSARTARGASREGSEGTPSMGSSFSDLDDASVTQSALEEALASRMQDGTIGSRMSVIGGTIGQAFRSRYLPKPNRQ